MKIQRCLDVWPLPAARCNEASAAFTMCRLGWGLSNASEVPYLGMTSLPRILRGKRRLATGTFPLKKLVILVVASVKGDSSPNWMSWSSQLRFISSEKKSGIFHREIWKIKLGYTENNMGITSPFRPKNCITSSGTPRCWKASRWSSNDGLWAAKGWGIWWLKSHIFDFWGWFLY